MSFLIPEKLETERLILRMFNLQQLTINIFLTKTVMKHKK